MTERRRRLIEVAFPLEEVSAHSRREKNVRHGHISTLHIWWARRPLAACRAFIYASLVDDPPTEREREELLKEVADLASWDAVRKPDAVVRPREKGGSGLTGRDLLQRARQRILDCNGGKPPRLLDPFAGGGAIPLEGLRLGCEVEASDLNPVAVLILKGTVEYPQKYGQPNSRPVPAHIAEADRTHDGQAKLGEAGWADAYLKNPLATDVRYWGNWMLERARVELAPYYPPDPDGSQPLAYLWSRTVPCPNCGAEMPLIRQYWLARKDKKKIWLEPVVNHVTKTVDFKIMESDKGAAPADAYDPGEATTSRGDTLCLVCGQVVKADFVRKTADAGQMRAMATSTILDASGAGGKRYRADTPSDEEALAAADRALTKLESLSAEGLSLIPDEPSRGTYGSNAQGGTYGFFTFGAYFNRRQLLALTTFSRIVALAYQAMVQAGTDTGYAEAVTTYLGLAVDRLADYNSSVTHWASHGEYVGNTFARQAISMTWDYCEINPFAGSTGGFDGALEWIAMTLEPVGLAALVKQAAAQTQPMAASIIVTDPPYYDSINYADLSDFFYVWLKRSLGFLHPQLLSLPLTPKREQAVMNIYGQQIGEGNRHEAARSQVSMTSSAWPQSGHTPCSSARLVDATM